MLCRIAQAHSSVILTSFWRHPKSRECGSGTPIGWIGDLPGTIVELYCACPSGLAFERFQDRSRHAGHLDGHRNVDRLRQQLAEAEEHGPLRVGKLIEVDTSVSVDLQRLIQLIEMDLGVGFPLRCFQRLSFPCLATRRYSWRHNRYTIGTSIPVLSY